MSHCTNCGSPIAPNSRFCTECGKPVQTTTPPVGMPPAGTQINGMPPMPPGPRPGIPPMSMPPMPQAGMPPMPPGARPAAPMAPTFPVAPAAPTAPAAPSVAAPAGISGALLSVPILGVSRGTLFNDDKMVTVLTMTDRMVLIPEGGSPKVEEIPGLRYALVGDYDGDGTQDLAVFTETQLWIVRYSALGSVPSGKVSLSAAPENLSTTALQHEGRTVLVSLTAEKVSFYVLHPARGLVEIGSAPVPPMAS